MASKIFCQKFHLTKINYNNYFLWLIIRTTKYFQYNNKCRWKKFIVDIKIFSAQGRAYFLHIMLPPLRRNKHVKSFEVNGRSHFCLWQLQRHIYICIMCISKFMLTQQFFPNCYIPYAVVNVIGTYTAISLKSWQFSRHCRHFYHMITGYQAHRKYASKCYLLKRYVTQHLPCDRRYDRL